jgi:hypothetical protein
MRIQLLEQPQRANRPAFRATITLAANEALLDVRRHRLAIGVI